MALFTCRLKAGHAGKTSWTLHVLPNFIMLLDALTKTYFVLRQSKDGDKTKPIIFFQWFQKRDNKLLEEAEYWHFGRLLIAVPFTFRFSTSGFVRLPKSELYVSSWNTFKNVNNNIKKKINTKVKINDFSYH